MTVMDRNRLAEEVAKLKAAGKRIVFTNGCFDILHPGHSRYLARAKARGDVLIVGVNSDRSVRKLKGEGRPIVSEAHRAEMVAALKPVDYVVIFDEDTPTETIRALRPDIHVKGGDYRLEDLPEREAVEEGGGRVIIVDLEPGLSTTTILEKATGKKGKKTGGKKDG
jgi:rfaE bifunctional protein nucleotidyltransferase chain/domain